MQLSELFGVTIDSLLKEEGSAESMEEDAVPPIPQPDVPAESMVQQPPTPNPYQPQQRIVAAPPKTGSVKMLLLTTGLFLFSLLLPILLSLAQLGITLVTLSEHPEIRNQILQSSLASLLIPLAATAVFSAVGLILLLILTVCKKIRTDKITGQATFFPLALILMQLLSFGYGYLQSLLIHLEQNDLAAAAQAFSSTLCKQTDITWGAECGWLWFFFLIFLLIRSETIRFRSWSIPLVAGIAAVWSIILLFGALPISIPLFTQSPELVALAKPLCVWHYAILWIERTMLFGFAACVGSKTFGGVRTMLFPVVMTLTQILALLILTLPPLVIGVHYRSADLRFRSPN